jgi:dihydrodipicolinate reductase
VSTPAGLSVKNLFNSINDMAILPAEGQIMSYEGFGVITESGVNGVGYDVVIKFSTGDMKLTYIVTVDPRVGQLNTLLVGCSTGCYDANTQQIQKLVKSFTVVDPSSLRGA